MSSLAPDAPTPAALSPWKSSGTLIVVVAGFLTAATCGLMIGRAFPSADVGDTARAALARGSLPLLHAQEEAIRWEASRNQDIAKLQQEVDALKQSLKTAQSDFNKKKEELASLELQMSTAEGRKKNAIDQIAKVQKIETAFQAADAERRKAEAAQMSTSGIQINYYQWQKEWNDATKDALEKIKIAEGNLLSIKERQPGWEASRDKLTADQKAEIKAAHESSQTSVQTATEAIATAKKQLEQRMKEQADELERAIQEISKK